MTNARMLQMFAVLEWMETAGRWPSTSNYTSHEPSESLLAQWVKPVNYFLAWKMKIMPKNCIIPKHEATLCYRPCQSHRCVKMNQYRTMMDVLINSATDGQLRQFHSSITTSVKHLVVFTDLGCLTTCCIQALIVPDWNTQQPDELWACGRSPILREICCFHDRKLWY